MNRRRGVIWIAAGLILALLAAGLSYFAFQQFLAQQEQAAPVEVKTTKAVVVANQLINQRAVIRPADVGTEERPLEEVPSGAIFKTEDAIGSIADRAIQPGQVLLTQYLAEEIEEFEPEVITETLDFNEALGEDLVAFAMPVTGRLAQEGILLPGDRVDLLFSTDVVGEEEGTGGKVAMYAIQDLQVLQVIYKPPPPPPKTEEGPPPTPAPPEPKTLVVAIDPQDAVVLKYALDTQASMELALRAEENERFFDVDSVTINTISERYEFIAPRPVP
jgi:Flp pilus assembly protein CpaB